MNRLDIRLAISELEKKKPKDRLEFEAIEEELNRLMLEFRRLTGV